MRKFASVLLGILFGLLCLLAATAVALGLIHVTGLPYYIDINALDIQASSGYARDVIVDNYNAAMHYLSPFSNEPFHLPDLAYSEGGAQHFADCKVIFNAVYIAGGASLVLLILIALLSHRRRNYLLVSGFTTLAVPAALLAVVAIDFDRVFLLFHQLFFSNDLWIFDSRYDEIITILPSAFFMHCAIVIAAFWVLSAILQFVGYGQKRQK